MDGQSCSEGIALKIIMISVLVMVGFAFGGQPLVGYNYGAKNKKRLSETIRFAFLLEVLTGAGMAVVLGAAAPLLVGLFLKEAVSLQWPSRSSAFSSLVCRLLVSYSHRPVFSRRSETGQEQ